MSSVSAVNTLLGDSSSTSSTSNGIDISSILAATSGNAAALDVNGAVSAAIYADRAPERIWQADQTTLSSETSALTAIQNATNAVSTDLNSLNTLTGPLATRTVTSSGSNVTATAAAGTVAGNHTVSVNSLASTASWYSDSASSATTVLPASSLTITTASGSTKTISTGSGAAGDTLTDLASAINAASLGVTASVVTDANGARLAIIANTSGAAADFSISSPNYSGTSWTSADIPPGDTLGANSFTLTSGGTTTTINTTAGESYATLASDINSQNLGVTATAGSDAGGTNLTITSGNGTPFTISEPSFGFSQAAVGADANLTVDGIPIQSASNTVTGAISGVSLTLLGASATPASLTVASDASQVSTAINQLVTDYNTAIGLVDAQFTVSSAGTEGVLAADSTITGLQSALGQALNYAGTPASGTTSTVNSLADLGITENSDGTLSVDSSTLNNALITNPSDVQNFFQGSALNGFAANFSTALNTFTDPVQGAFTLDLNGISAENTNYTNEINSLETNYIANQQTILTAKFSAAEAALQNLPTQLNQIQAELGNKTSGSGS
jgi:flagellar hook-associated protein 2